MPLIVARVCVDPKDVREDYLLPGKVAEVLKFKGELIETLLSSPDNPVYVPEKDGTRPGWIARIEV